MNVILVMFMMKHLTNVLTKMNVWTLKIHAKAMPSAQIHLAVLSVLVQKDTNWTILEEYAQTSMSAWKEVLQSVKMESVLTWKEASNVLAMKDLYCQLLVILVWT